MERYIRASKNYITLTEKQEEFPKKMKKFSRSFNRSVDKR